MGRLLLVRHGQASFLSEDYDRLSSTGEVQSRRLGTSWARVRFRPDRVFVGPRVRQSRTGEIAREAAQIVGLSWPAIEPMPALDEMHTEALVRRMLPAVAEQDEEVRAQYQTFTQANADPRARARVFQKLYERVVLQWARGGLETEGIEPFKDFLGRVRTVLAELTRVGEGQRGRTVVAFTSGGVIGAAVRQAVECPEENALELAWRVYNSSVTEFLFDGRRLSLQSFNVLSHLEDPGLWTYR